MKRNYLRMRYLITVGLLIAINFNTFCQYGKIIGTVKNAEGNAAEFVNIRLKEINKGIITNAKGDFELANITPNNYTLVASFVGYTTLEKSIKIEADKIITIKLELQETGELLNEIVVKGYVNANEKPVELGKIAIKPMDLPQAVYVIDQKVLEQQQVLRLSDVLMNTNGVYIMGTTGGYQEEVAGRGFAFGSSNTFKNGVRYFNGMINEMSSLEKVEIMKGSTAILFGNVAAGGILNYVTKKPKFDFGGELSMRTGSFGLIKPAFDIYSGIGKSKKIAFRLNGTLEQANSFRKGVTSERYYINPSVLYNINPKTSLLIEADYLKDTRTADFGAGIINYEIVKLPREQFVGVPWSKNKANQSSTTATFNQTLGNNWKLTAIGGFRKYETDLFANTRPNSGTAIAKDGTWIRNIQKTSVADKYYIGQVDLKGNFSTGKITHQALIGFDTDNYTTSTTAYSQLARYDTINIFGTKQYKIRTDIPTLSKATITSAPVHRFGIYAQNLIGLSQYVKVLLGIRYSYQDTESNVLTVSTNKTVTTHNYDGAFSPRFGLIIQPNKFHSIFASYANSFTTNTGVDITGNALPPSLIDQYEIGLKNELFNGKISANATIYRIYNNNLAQISLESGNTNTNIKELAGGVQSEGIELDLVARPILGLNFLAGYSYNRTKYVHSNTYEEGSLLKYNPNHTANASANYGFGGKLKGLTVGLTGLYFGDRWAGRNTRLQVKNDVYKLVKISAYTQLDANISYTFKHYSLRGKIGNIANTLSYNVHDDNSVNPITPRNYSIAIAYKW